MHVSECVASNFGRSVSGIFFVSYVPPYLCRQTQENEQGLVPSISSGKMSSPTHFFVQETYPSCIMRIKKKKGKKP